jgi:hypothetical protein
MKTQTKYEEIILNEIRSLPPFILPQAVKILKSLKEGVENETFAQLSPFSQRLPEYFPELIGLK